MRLLIGNLTKI